MMLDAKAVEAALRGHPRVAQLLGNAAHQAAAEAAVTFFTTGIRPANENWFRSETWQHVMNAFCDAAPFQGPWVTVDNQDNGSLCTGSSRLRVGDVVRIGREGDRRFVTYVMGSNVNGWHAAFKGQGAVPNGVIEWCLIASLEPPVLPPPPPNGHDPREDKKQEGGSSGRKAGWDCDRVEKVFKAVGAVAAAIGAIAAAILALLKRGD